MGKMSWFIVCTFYFAEAEMSILMKNGCHVSNMLEQSLRQFRFSCFLGMDIKKRKSMKNT